MTTTQLSERHLPTIRMDRQIIHEPAVVFTGYIALALLAALGLQTVLQITLAVILAFLGPGAALVAVLYPKPGTLDAVERIALSACFSVAIGGIAGFALARSPWGLRLWPFLAVNLGFSLICSVLAWRQRRNLADSEKIFQVDLKFRLPERRMDQGIFRRTVTIILFAVLFSGIWGLSQVLQKPPLDPPMTEFYLLGKDGQTQDYPKNGKPGETLLVNYGIVNRENRPSTYQVKAFINEKEVGKSPIHKLDSSEELSINNFQFHTLSSNSGLTKVEFVLFKGEVPHRYLHLWINVSDQ